MNKYVNLNDAAQALAHNMKDITQKLIAIGILLDVPEADVRPIVYGKWIQTGRKIRCSICNHGVFIGTEDPDVVDAEIRMRHYCSYCGAKMGESNNE